MSAPYVVLALLMGLATYPSRALPLLAPGIQRLRPAALLYLRLVGPAVLASLGAATVLVRTDGGGATLGVGVDTVAVSACVAVVALRRNLLLGLVVAVTLVVLGRAAELG